MRKIIQQLLILFYINEKEIYSAICKKKQKILNDFRWRKEGSHYLAVKKLSALLSRITSKHKDGFYFLNCLQLEEKIKLNLIIIHVKIRIYVDLQCH